MEKSNGKIRPIFDRVLLQKETENQTNCGIIIPKCGDDRCNIMRVVAVGETKNVAVGERVIVAKYSGTEIRVGGDVFTIVCEYDILACLRSNDDTASLARRPSTEHGSSNEMAGILPSGEGI
jgi:chaperonin GroES